MKFSDMRSRLAARLRPGKRPGDNSNTDQAFEAPFPEPDIVSASQQQKDSAFMQMPREIRRLIFESLWNDAGVAQHIIFQSGRYTSEKCVTNHSAAGDLMKECAERQTSRFQDAALWRRMTSTWGNHWKCEEFHQDRKSKAMRDASWSPFLTMMLVCKQMYIESRASVYSTLTFVIHDMETLYSFTVSRRLPIINDIQHLHIAMRLPVRRESKSKMSPEANATMSRWRDCCRAIDRLPSLAAVDMWLDTAEPAWRAVLSEIPGPNANPFVFGDRLAGILTVDLPVNPERSDAWQEVAKVEPRFSVRARGWPAFRAETETTNVAAHSIIKLWESAEPGAPQSPLVFSTK